VGVNEFKGCCKQLALRTNKTVLEFAWWVNNYNQKKFQGIGLERHEGDFICGSAQKGVDNGQRGEIVKEDIAPWAERPQVGLGEASFF